jgi:Flp pilus assembly protein TadD
VIASAAHATHKKHDPAHTAKPSGLPSVAAAAPVAASPSAAAAGSAPPPSAPKGALAEGDGLFRGGDVEGALAKYQEAARANPSDAKAQKMIGKCYNRLGQHDRAVPYLKKYLDLLPDASDKAFIQAQIDQK